MLEKEITREEKAFIRSLSELRKFEFVPITQLVIPNVHGFKNRLENIGIVKDDMVDHGLLSPISIAGPYNDGRFDTKGEYYLVVDGARRLKAWRAMFFKGDIPCYIVAGAVDDNEINLLSFGANRVHRKGDVRLNVIYTQLMADEQVNGAISKTEMLNYLSRAMGVTPRRVRQYVNIVYKGSENLQNKVANGDIPVKVAEDIARKYSNDVEQQNLVVSVLEDQPKASMEKFRPSIKQGEFDSHKVADLQDQAKRILKIARNENVKTVLTRTQKDLKLILKNKHDVPKADAKELVKLCKNIIEAFD